MVVLLTIMAPFVIKDNPENLPTVPKVTVIVLLVTNLKYFLLFIVFLSCSCAERKDNFSGFFCDPENNFIDLDIDTLELECLRPTMSGISYVGFSAISGESLFWADALFANLNHFDKEGNYLNTVIHYGNGPHEIPVSRIQAYCVSSERHHFFLDSSTNLYEFDQNFNLVNRVLYYWNKKITKGDICERTEPYSTAWGENVNLTVHDGLFYTNIYGESDEFNITIPEYYKTARIIEPRDVRTGDPFPLLGRITPAVGYMTPFQKDFFRISDSGDFFVAFEADDLIYVYNSKYKLKYSFGQPGKNMNKDYKTLNVENFYNDLMVEQEIRGRYTSLCVWGDLTFRTYLTGAPDYQNRLQIYDKTTMIGDVLVPSGFKVMGYIDPFFYSEFICDEDNENIEIYRFKL